MVVIDGITTKYLDINRGVPQGTVLGPVIFSLMVNDIRLIYPENNSRKIEGDSARMVSIAKCADDITITALAEVKNIESWANKNRMSLNFSKTCEMIVRTGRTTKPLPSLMYQGPRKGRGWGLYSPPPPPPPLF